MHLAVAQEPVWVSVPSILCNKGTGDGGLTSQPAGDQALPTGSAESLAREDVSDSRKNRTGMPWIRSARQGSQVRDTRRSIGSFCTPPQCENYLCCLPQLECLARQFWWLANRFLIRYNKQWRWIRAPEMNDTQNLCRWAASQYTSKTWQER